MAIRLMAGKCNFFVNGIRQLLFEELSFEFDVKLEELMLLDDPYKRYREIKIEGEGTISYLLQDQDDYYGPAELLAYVLGYNTWDTVNDIWDIVNEQFTIDTDGNLKRYTVDRQGDSSGAGTVIGNTANFDFTYDDRGMEYIDQVCLDLTSIAGLTDEDISVVMDPVGTPITSYIEYADGIVTGQKWYTLKDGSGGLKPLAVNGTTLRLTIAGSQTVTVDDNLGQTKPWYMIRLYNSNHLTIEVEVLTTDKVAYLKWTFDKVFVPSVMMKFEPQKAARATVKFAFEDVTPSSATV